MSNKPLGRIRFRILKRLGRVASPGQGDATPVPDDILKKWVRPT